MLYYGVVKIYSNVTRGVSRMRLSTSTNCFRIGGMEDLYLTLKLIEDAGELDLMCEILTKILTIVVISCYNKYKGEDIYAKI